MAAICPVKEPSFRLPSFRLPDASPLADQEHLERRQFFLRSYLFSREPLEHEGKASNRFFVDLRALCRIRRIIWSRLRRFYGVRRRKFSSRRAMAPPPAVAYPGRGASAASKRRLSDFIAM